MKEKKQSDVAVLLKYAGSYKRLTFLGLGLSTLAMILGMAPYICIWLVARDLISAAPNWTEASGVARYGWMAFGFAVAGILIYFAALMCTHLAAFRTASNIRKQGMAHLMNTPLGFFDSNASGLIRNRLDGAASETETLLAHNLADIVESAAMLISMIVLMFVFDWRMALACLWGVPVAFLLLFGSRKLTKHNSEVTKAAGIQVSDGIQETLENIRVIRATNQEDRFLKVLNDKIDHHEKTMLRGELQTGIFVNAASVIMRLGVATTILTGTSLILSGQIDFMVLFMFLLAITRVYAPFDQALALIAEMFMSQICASRLMEIYDAGTAEGADSFVPAGHDIVFENVGFSYETNSGKAGRENGPGRDDEQVLRGVSFTAKEGEVTALVGPSGSGKSTCARLAARLWDISEGVIRVGGIDISTVDPEVLLTDYSMVFQDVVLFDDTVMDNIRLGRHGATDQEVLAAAAAANCDEFVEKMPQGYATPIGENGAKLSGGERQRISIARALLKNEPIVLLDEATASLDVENETKVQGALSRLLAGKTVLVIAHRMRTVEAADKIVVLADGKVAEEGSPDELLARENGIFRRITQLQSASAAWSI
ncbi:MAG: ABC transporter ATP-binding protein [Eubacterium sp.]|nr:ABC transporter ATP-binding protein [Eubacterium sp.]